MENKEIIKLIGKYSGKSVSDIIAIELYSKGVTSQSFGDAFLFNATKIEHCVDNMYTNNVYNSLKNIEQGFLKIN